MTLSVVRLTLRSRWSLSIIDSFQSVQSRSLFLTKDFSGSTENAGPENEGPTRDQIDQRPTDTTEK